jgi:predicted HicB family RNase H-like nuclease
LFHHSIALGNFLKENLRVREKRKKGERKMLDQTTAKRGRPHLIEQGVTVHVRLSQKLFKTVQPAAEAEGLSMASFIRRTLTLAVRESSFAKEAAE